MPVRVQRFFFHLTLVQRFVLASLIILMAGMVGIGFWVEKQIENEVIHRTGITTAMYVDGFVAPYLQELGSSNSLTPEHIQALDRLLQETSMGRQIVSFKVWNTSGQVLYSNDPATIGQSFPLHESMLKAAQGQVASEISNLEDEENAPLKLIRPQLMETYSPVRLAGTDRIIALAEFYHTIDDLQKEIAAVKRSTWLVVGTAGLLMFVLLAGFAKQASDTIEQQRGDLSEKVARLTELLEQNAELHERVRRAAGSVATLNEQILRRTGAELHDGPAQELGLALLQLDTVIELSEVCSLDNQNGKDLCTPLTAIQTNVQSALKEIRSITAGLGLPQLAEMTLEQAVQRSVRAHERRTGSQVSLEVGELPDQAPLPVKITSYRIIQEALNNAYRHAGGAGQRVCVSQGGDGLLVEISDQGPGFDIGEVTLKEGRLGLSGMRERVESLGGQLKVEAGPGKGTRVLATLPLEAEEVDDGR